MWMPVGKGGRFDATATGKAAGTGTAYGTQEGRAAARGHGGCGGPVVASDSV